MGKHTITMPNVLDLSSALDFSSSLSSITEAEEYELDFMYLSWIEPFALLYVANSIKNFVAINENASFSVINLGHQQAHSYAAHMGFFQFIGANYGNKPGEAKSNNRYVPITFINSSEIISEANKSYQEVGEVIEKRSRQLSRILTLAEGGELEETLTYSFREIIRNVVEHSKSPTIGYCAQYWPTKQKAEIAVIDVGIGVKSSLSQNSKYTRKINDDRDALHLALMPGVSSKIIGLSDDVWANSGFGLYMTSRLCGEGGSFFICSGVSGLLLEESKKIDKTTNLGGTALRLVLKTERMEQLRHSLARISKEGQAIIKQTSEDGEATASVASQMLSKDFPKH